MTWEDVKSASPEIIIVSPCGYRLEDSAQLARAIQHDVAAKVIAVDANAYFARPGPRYAEAVEVLAHLLHPKLIQWAQSKRPWTEIR